MPAHLALEKCCLKNFKMEIQDGCPVDQLGSQMETSLAILKLHFALIHQGLAQSIISKTSVKQTNKIRQNKDLNDKW